MTQEHSLAAYKHYKDLLENPEHAGMKKVFKDNVQHGLNSILIRHPEYKNISEEKEEEPKEEKPKKKKEK